MKCSQFWFWNFSKNTGIPVTFQIKNDYFDFYLLEKRIHFLENRNQILNSISSNQFSIFQKFDFYLLIILFEFLNCYRKSGISEKFSKIGNISKFSIYQLHREYIWHAHPQSSFETCFDLSVVFSKISEYLTMIKVGPDFPSDFESFLIYMKIRIFWPLWK